MHCCLRPVMMTCVHVHGQVCAVTRGGAFAEEAVVPAGAVLKLPPGVDVTTAAGVLLAYSQCHRLLQRGSMQLQWYLPLTTGDLSTVQACQWRLAHRTWRLRCARGSAQGRLCSCLARPAAWALQPCRHANSGLAASLLHAHPPALWQPWVLMLPHVLS